MQTLTPAAVLPYVSNRTLVLCVAVTFCSAHTNTFTFILIDLCSSEPRSQAAMQVCYFDGHGTEECTTFAMDYAARLPAKLGDCFFLVITA